MTIRFDLTGSRERLSEATASIRADVAGLEEHARLERNTPRTDTHALEEYTAAARALVRAVFADTNETPRRFMRAALATRVSALAQYRHFESVGSITSGGLVVSRLVPDAANKESAGWRLVGTLQAVDYDPRAGSHSTVALPGVAIIRQDRVPYITTHKDANGTEVIDTVDLARWRWQIGGEYSRELSVRGGGDRGESYSAFYRFRYLKSNW